MVFIDSNTVIKRNYKEIVTDIDKNNSGDGINDKSKCHTEEDKYILDNNVILKPLLRGFIHFGAFICSFISFIFFIITSFHYKFNLGVFIHLMSQMLQFGVSATYHIPNWSPKVKKFWRFFDHGCIPILVSGTHTSIILNNINHNQNNGFYSHFSFIKLTWFVSLVLIARLILYRKLHDIFDLCCHILHGMAVLPYISLLSHLSYFDLILIFFGGFFYITGGVIYGMEKPNPIPRIFGFHEIFHVFTVIANFCFGVVISKDYVISIFSKSN